MKFVPAVGLLLASPVIWQAVVGDRTVSEALLVWLLAMVLALAGWWLWSAATRPPRAVDLPVVPMPAPPLRRRDDDRA